MIGWLAFKRRLCVVALAIELTAIGISAASAQMYSDTVLKRKLDRIRTGLIATIEIEIPKLADPSDRGKLRTLKADLPLRGRGPLDLYFNRGKIAVPAETLQFIDDLATLQAWLDKHECASDRLLPNYLHRTELTDAEKRKSPLTAFGLRSDDLLLDSYVNNLSLKYYNSSVWFLLAHEIGHVGQVSDNDPDKTIMRERDADAFAIKVLRRGRLNPAGIYLYFLATSFGETLNAASAHPASAERIRAVAVELRRNPSDFVAIHSKTPSQDAQVMLQIADNVDRIAKLLGANQALRKKIEKEKGPEKLAKIDAEVFPKIDFTRACPKGRRS